MLLRRQAVQAGFNGNPIPAPALPLKGLGFVSEQSQGKISIAYTAGLSRAFYRELRVAVITLLTGSLLRVAPDIAKKTG